MQGVSLPPSAALPGQMRPGMLPGQHHPPMSPALALQQILQRHAASTAAGSNPAAFSQPQMGTYTVGGVNMQLPRMDPWRALVISWDQDTPHNWPGRVSPWEVAEDKGGILRAEKVQHSQDCDLTALRSKDSCLHMLWLT